MIGDKPPEPRCVAITWYQNGHLEYELGSYRMTALYRMGGNTIWDFEFSIRLFDRDLYWEEW